MIFNSIDFVIFFPTVCLVYFLLKNNKLRNIFMLIASYYFYMNWQPIYALLLFSSTLFTYFSGILTDKYFSNRSKKKIIVSVNIILNLSILLVFKYFNLINESVFSLLDLCGLHWNVPNLDVLLPIGISFYTFQVIGYSIDVYRGNIKAERDFFTYALFVAFFPQLVAGPIERAKNMLPQFHERHTFKYDDVAEGFKLMIWGFFMKLCVADRLGEYVDAVYNNVAQHNGTSMAIATIFFAFQIYCDFGGYSCIAIGAARVMGFRLMDNFNRPYFSLSVKEFWYRWHISLSSWFKDYVYIPLGGNRVKYCRHLLNLLITFVISGLWHGANWTFLVWGTLHGAYMIFGSLFRRYVRTPEYGTTFSKIMHTALCFALVTFAWIFFRANNITDAFTIISKIVTDIGKPFDAGYSFLAYSTMSLLLLIFKDMKDHFDLNINFMHSNNQVVRYAAILMLVSYILLFGALDGGQFIYFQF